MSKSTFREGILDAIALLSTKVPTTMGRFCSAADLATVGGPTFSAKLYISHLQNALNREGSYAEGINFAVHLLETKAVGRKEVGLPWTLVNTENVEVGTQLYIAELQRMLDPNG